MRCLKKRDYTKIKAKFNAMFNNRQYVAKWKDIRDYQLPSLDYLMMNKTNRKSTPTKYK